MLYARNSSISAFSPARQFRQSMYSWAAVLKRCLLAIAPALASCATNLPSWYVSASVGLDRLPGRRPSAGRQDSRSTTPVVIVNLGIGFPIYLTVDWVFPVTMARTWNSLSADKVTLSNSLLPFKTKLIYSWNRFYSFQVVSVCL